jgi:hypothetical protein
MLTPERIDAIFTEMETYVIDLVADPTSLGPQYFRDQIAICRNHLNRVSLVASELDRERLSVSSELLKLEALFSLEHDNLLANDQRVKSLGNIEDRKATVGFILRDQRGQINELKDRLHAAEAVYKVVTLRNRDLSSTMTAIKDQKRAMQSEIRSGSFYGDERIPDISSMSEVSSEDLAKLLSDDPDEVITPDAEGTETHEDASDEEAAIQNFLAGDSRPAEKEELSDDFTSLFEGL